MNTEDAYKILGVQIPFTEQELKSAFRKVAMELHPDHQGDPVKFREAKEAYDLLLPDAGKDRIVDPISRTVDGVSLSTLGKGLRVNGRKCNGCDGRGYYTSTFQEYDYERPKNIWDYYRILGEARQARRVTRNFLCRSCNGTGEIALFNPVLIKNAITQKQRKRATQ